MGRPGERLDAGAPVALAEQLDNAWAPSLAARGDRILLSWTDFRAYKWDVYARVLRDRGATFGAETRVNDAPEADEAQLDGDGGRQLNAFAPAVAPLPGDRLAVAWRSHRRATADVHARLVGGRIVRVDDAGRRDVNSWRPAVARAGRGRVVVAWEDDRDGPTAIFRRVLVLPSAASPHERRRQTSK